MFFFFNDTATTEIYTLSLHDALPISARAPHSADLILLSHFYARKPPLTDHNVDLCMPRSFLQEKSCSIFSLRRSEEHTSELQSRQYLVCRLLLEKKKKRISVQQSIIL